MIFSILIKFTIVAPFICIGLAFLGGSKAWKNFFLLYALNWLVAFVVGVTLGFGYLDVFETFLVFVLMVTFMPSAVALASIRLSGWTSPAPIEQAYACYDDLSPEDKAKAHAFAKSAFGLGCKAAGRHFRQKDHRLLSDLFGLVAKLV